MFNLVFCLFTILLSNRILLQHSIFTQLFSIELFLLETIARREHPWHEFWLLKNMDVIFINFVRAKDIFAFKYQFY